MTGILTQAFSVISAHGLALGAKPIRSVQGRWVRSTQRLLKIAQAGHGCAAPRFTCQYWKTTDAIHHMLARHATKTCESVAERVATTQNLGHTDVLTTLRSYGQITREDQRRLITGLVDEV